MQVPLAWHWETFKELYEADDDGSCGASCHHLRAVQAVAKEKVEAKAHPFLQCDQPLLVQYCGYLYCIIGVIRKACGASKTLLGLQDAATCQELYCLGVLQFLVDEMKGQFVGPQFLHGALQGSPLLRRTTAGSKSPSPDRIPGRLNSLKSPGRNKPCLGNQPTRNSISTSLEQPFKSINRSPVPRTPTVSTMEEANSQAEAVDRGGNLHVPASAPTSSAHSSPRVSARRALSLAPSPVANRSPIVSPSKQPLAPLPPQSATNNARETVSAFKQTTGQSRPSKQSSGGFRDEHRPVRGLGSPDSPRLGELPAGFQPCGDLNEDIKQWEGHEKEVRCCSSLALFHIGSCLLKLQQYIYNSERKQPIHEAGNLSSICVTHAVQLIDWHMVISWHVTTCWHVTTS